MLVTDALNDLLAPTITGLGYELLGIERLHQAAGLVLRIYIDSAKGIGIDDCETVSRQVSALLDAEDVIGGEYTLEVSSPGAERPLFSPAQFEAHLGAEVKLKLASLVDGRRRITGRLAAATPDGVTIEVEEHGIEVPYHVIDKAHLVAQW